MKTEWLTKVIADGQVARGKPLENGDVRRLVLQCSHFYSVEENQGPFKMTRLMEAANSREMCALFGDFAKTETEGKNLETYFTLSDLRAMEDHRFEKLREFFGLLASDLFIDGPELKTILADAWANQKDHYRSEMEEVFGSVVKGIPEEDLEGLFLQTVKRENVPFVMRDSGPFFFITSVVKATDIGPWMEELGIDFSDVSSERSPLETGSPKRTAAASSELNTPSKTAGLKQMSRRFALTPKQKVRYRRTYEDYRGCLLWILTIVLAFVGMGVLFELLSPVTDGMSEDQIGIIGHGLQQGIIWGLILMVVGGFLSLPRSAKQIFDRILGTNFAGKDAEDEEVPRDVESKPGGVEGDVPLIPSHTRTTNRWLVIISVVGVTLVVSVGLFMHFGPYSPENREKKTVATLRSLATSCEAFAVDKAYYPSARTIDELIPQVSYYLGHVSGFSQDPWGNEIGVAVHPKAGYRICSAGPDGKRWTDDDISYGMPHLRIVWGGQNSNVCWQSNPSNR